MTITSRPASEGSNSTWNRLAKSFHWLIAGLLLLAIAMAFLAGHWPELGGSRKQQYLLYMLHKSLGLSVLVLAILRLAWRFFSQPPAPLANHSELEHKAASAAHWALYGLLFALPLSGWWLNSVADVPLKYFLLFPVPALGAAQPALEDLVGQIHYVLGIALMVILAAHLAGAFKHHWLDNDSTLTRMLPGGSLGKVTLFGIAALLAGVVTAGILAEVAELKKPPVTAEQAEFDDSSSDASTAMASDLTAASEANAQDGSTVNEPSANRPADEPSAVLAQRWQASPESTLQFTVDVMGETVNGSFKRFSAKVNFEPDNLPKSRISAVISTASIFTNNSTRDDMLPESDWFAVQQYNAAEFRTQAIRATDEGFIADATLRIRDVTRPVKFTFRWQQQADSATLIGNATLNRLNYKLGAAEFADSDTIAYQVPVIVNLTLSR